jgi:hypothetical protein
VFERVDFSDNGGPGYEIAEWPLTQFFDANTLTDPPGWSPFYNNLYAQCITEARNKFRSTKAGWGENIGQARSTVEMIAKPTITVLKAYRYARSGNWRAVRELFGSTRRHLSGGSLADTWLQYIYGWKPLMADIKDSCDYFQEIQRNDPSLIRVQRNTHGNYKYTQHSGRYTIDYECNAKIRCGLAAQVNSTFLVGLDSMGVANPASLAWDLLPFSFLADWFIPVGNVLESLSATLGLDFHSGYITGNAEVSRTIRLTEPAGGWRILNGGRCVIENRTMRREVLHDFPYPQIYTKSPFKTGNAINALALLRSLRS